MARASDGEWAEFQAEGLDNRRRTAKQEQADTPPWWVWEMKEGARGERVSMFLRKSEYYRK
jgi:hypothetical protein